MPELPDVVVYLERLRALVLGVPLENVRLKSPFLVRTYDPPISALEARKISELSRLGKRLVFHFEGDLFMVLHLMIAGRLHWKARGASVPGKMGLAAFDFPNGTLTLTEAGTKKRASLHVVRGREALHALDRGGIEVHDATQAEFAERLTAENRTLKRALTDPRILSGIGNAYSDEILFRARLSPVKRTAQLTEEEIARLFVACRETLTEWTDRLRRDVGEEFPEGVTAFRDEMAVHGKFKKPCPVCGTKVQRIVFEANEVNYCPRCQTGGRLLADRSLSRLLRGDWPKSIEELEEIQIRRCGGEEQKRR